MKHIISMKHIIFALCYIFPKERERSDVVNTILQDFDRIRCRTFSNNKRREFSDQHKADRNRAYEIRNVIRIFTTSMIFIRSIIRLLKIRITGDSIETFNRFSGNGAY